MRYRYLGTSCGGYRLIFHYSSSKTHILCNNDTYTKIINLSSAYISLSTFQIKEKSLTFIQLGLRLFLTFTVANSFFQYNYFFTLLLKSTIILDNVNCTFTPKQQKDKMKLFKYLQFEILLTFN